MPGRQSHGRPLIAAPKSKATKKTKTRAQKNALNAFGIAEEHFPERVKKTPRNRQLEPEPERKHSRDDEDEDEDDEDEDMPRRKKIKTPARPLSGDAEHGSDSEGNEWTLGGMAEDDDDSEIESDDAFGDSDDEKFGGYTFRGSKSTKRKDDDDGDDSEDDSNDDEGQTLGEEAIDLATALDQWEESSEEEAKDGAESDSDASSGSGSSGDSDDDDEEDSDEEDSAAEGDEADPEQLRKLRGLVSGFGGEEDDDGEDTPAAKQKISLGDLGLGSLNDPFMKQSVKLMKKEQKEKKPGAAKKLDVPLARREQGRLDRSVAYEKTNETLDRWTETVKQNRRAEHLVFPLPENSAKAGLDLTEMQPLTASNTHNELESAIFGIMDQSGLSMEKEKKEKEKEYDDEGNELSRKEILNRKRMERELQSREAKRAARIKKIKSKAYHRVHRRQRERDEMATQEAMAEAGEVDSEEEREAQDRRRALERVGLRHKDSKWAKMGSKVKRAVWDDDFRTGLTEMARKDEELRRRVEGRAGVSDDDETSSSGSDSEDDGDASLRRQLAALEEDDGEPQSKLMSMKFMQKAEAARKQENDDLIKSIRRELDGEEAEESGDDEGNEVGRKQYGGDGGKVFAPAIDTSKMSVKKPRKTEEDDDDDDEVTIKISSNGNASKAAAPALAASTANTTAGAWSSGEVRRKKKGSGSNSAKLQDFDLNANIMVASGPKKPKATTTKEQQPGQAGDDSDADSDADHHMPLAIRDQKLVARAFAGEDVVGDFEAEKRQVAEDDDDKVIDNTLPGWGSWVGDGVSNREKKRHQGRFLTKVEGVKKKDRKDAKLDKVIINEKRIKKNDRYLASQLPHPFESRQQYERSLQQPVGPEWQTKQTFQENTKPRVIMKQGIIAPMSKPRA